MFAFEYSTLRFPSLNSAKMGQLATSERARSERAPFLPFIVLPLKLMLAAAATAALARPGAEERTKTAFPSPTDAATIAMQNGSRYSEKR